MPTLGGGHRQAVALEDLLPLGYPASAPAPWGARLTWSEDWLTLPGPAFDLLLETCLRQRLQRTGETRAQALRSGTFFGDFFRGLVSLRSDDDAPARFAASGDPLRRWLGWVLDPRLWAPFEAALRDRAEAHGRSVAAELWDCVERAVVEALDWHPDHLFFDEYGEFTREVATRVCCDLAPLSVLGDAVPAVLDPVEQFSEKGWHQVAGRAGPTAGGTPLRSRRYAPRGYVRSLTDQRLDRWQEVVALIGNPEWTEGERLALLGLYEAGNVRALSDQPGLTRDSARRALWQVRRAVREQLSA